MSKSTASAFAVTAPSSETETLRTISGETPGGAKILIQAPKDVALCGKVLLYCHGFRPEGIPLHASFKMDGADEGQLTPLLLRLGWVIAATSYRREGYILKDAVEDVVLLRERVLKECFSASASGLGSGSSSSLPRCYAFGTSMGGAVITLLAERHPEAICAAMGVGAALFIRHDPVGAAFPIRFTHRPLVPLLFLANYSEQGAPGAYIKQCKALLASGSSAASDSGDSKADAKGEAKAADKDKGTEQERAEHEREQSALRALQAKHATQVPALWQVQRTGHIVLRWSETRPAWEHLLAWSDGKLSGISGASDSKQAEGDGKQEQQLPALKLEHDITDRDAVALEEATKQGSRAPPSSAVFVDKHPFGTGRAAVSTTLIASMYGDVITRLIADDLERLHVRPNSFFTACILRKSGASGATGTSSAGGSAAAVGAGAADSKAGDSGGAAETKATAAGAGDAKASAPAEFDFSGWSCVKQLNVRYSFFPYAGVAIGTWISSVLPTGYLEIAIHHTGTTLNAAVKECGLQDGDALLVCEPAAPAKGAARATKSNAMQERLRALSAARGTGESAAAAGGAVGAGAGEASAAAAAGAGDASAPAAPSM